MHESKIAQLVNATLRSRNDVIKRRCERNRDTFETLLFERAGESWVPNTFGTFFTRALRDAGVPHVRLHDLRHLFASMALEAGVDLKTVSSALGHSTISTTADIYAHVTDSLMEAAAKRIHASIARAVVRTNR